MALSLPYYYGHSGEQYAFFRIPKLLLTDDRFAEVSTDAKLLYGLLLDRMELSYRNGWIDDQNRVFIIFTAEEVMSTLHCRSEKAARLFAELDSTKGIGLIERKRQGLGRPTIIYTAVFTATGAASSAENADTTADSSADFNYALLLIPLGILALGGVGYGGYKGYKHYQNKKRGYE